MGDKAFDQATRGQWIEYLTARTHQADFDKVTTDDEVRPPPPEDDMDGRDQHDPTGSASDARETTVVVRVDEHALAIRKAWESYGGGYYGCHRTGKAT